MGDNDSREPMLDMFIIETTQLTEQLEQTMLNNEKVKKFVGDSVNEIFRIMHTIKGSSAMMLFNDISTLTHGVEDLFYYIREEKPQTIDFSKLCDLVFKAIDYIKGQIEQIESNNSSNGDSSSLINEIKDYLNSIKLINGDKSSTSKPQTTSKTDTNVSNKVQTENVDGKDVKYKNTFKALITFTDGCQMENIRAFSVTHSLNEIGKVLEYEPSNIIEDETTSEIIRKEGFSVKFASDMTLDEARETLFKTVFLRDLEIKQLEDSNRSLVNEEVQKAKPKTIVLDDEEAKAEASKKSDDSNLVKSNVTKNVKDSEKEASNSATQSYISVNLNKLDTLMDLVGELVISEAMVTRNPEIMKLEIEGFMKAARQHRKIISEIQDMVMSVRMVPLTLTFQKMNRIVRDMTKKLKKEAELVIIGEDTEVDKNVIEHISDPLMHLIRNSIDHGLELPEERKAKNKSEVGKIILEANNVGGEVIISVKDDGKGLDKSKIYAKAYANGLTSKAESELTDKEMYSFIFMPGFSTNENVTEYSGRGVGMDVVVKNIEKVGGTVDVDSKPGEGTTVNIKIPLTLAIIDGMIVTVGHSSYIVPTVTICESFRPKEKDVIADSDGNELIMIRGNCYPILRLHKLFGVKTDVTSLSDGIILMLENENGALCIFVDSLIGEQQVVVKALPKYINKIKGLAGCTLLGDGSISLIIDVGMLINSMKER